MDDHQTQIEIQKQLRDKQEKFVYYVMALCVASIAFSVTQTVGQKLSCNYIPLGCAIFCWVGSTLCGFQFIQISMKGLVANDKYFESIKKHSQGGVSNSTIDKALGDILHEKRNAYSKLSHTNFMWQQYLFYIGLGLFLVWHVIQMSKN